MKPADCTILFSTERITHKLVRSSINISNMQRPFGVRVQVVHKQQGRRHLGVMCDEESEAANASNKVLQGGQGNGQAVMRGCAPPQLINNHQGALCSTSQYCACLTQLLQPCIHCLIA